MSVNTARKHYEHLLAKHYSWMFGDFEEQVEKNRNWFENHRIRPGSGGNALDLGCGSGFQSLALSSLGFTVTAVDFNQDLLDELKEHDPRGAIRTIQSDMLDREKYSRDAPFELAVCMGDTLPHLPSEEAVSDFFRAVHDLLEPGGKFILSFRDYSAELSGADRFIPVQSDRNRIMTVFLEYDPEYVFVHDLVHEYEGGTWCFEKSVYRKIRLTPDRVDYLLKGANFKTERLEPEHGMTFISATRHH